MLANSDNDVNNYIRELENAGFQVSPSWDQYIIKWKDIAGRKRWAYIALRYGNVGSSIRNLCYCKDILKRYCIDGNTSSPLHSGYFCFKDITFYFTENLGYVRLNGEDNQIKLEDLCSV